MNSQSIIGWVKIAIGGLAAASSSGLVHIDPQLTGFLLALYAAISGGNNVAKGGTSS